jgi:hypothetical protein
MSYGIFSGPDDYRADMRNLNYSNDLSSIQNVDYPADMRKCNENNDLRRGIVLADSARAARARR